MDLLNLKGVQKMVYVAYFLTHFSNDSVE